MSRMEKAIDNLSNVALNTNASRGRIEDADFAKESARLTRAQILQQSAMAMIAQAGKAQNVYYNYYNSKKTKFILILFIKENTS